MAALPIEQLREIIVGEVTRAFRRRMSESRPLKLDLNNPQLFLRRLRQTPSVIPVLMALHGDACPDEWRIVAGLQHVVEEAFQRVLNRLKLLDSNTRTLMVGVMSASLFAERLRTQLGAGGAPWVDKSRLPPQERRALTRCAEDADKARALPETLTGQLLQNLWRDVVRGRSEGPRKCCTLRFRTEHDNVHVDWLAQDESIVDSQTLQDFIGPALNVVLPGFVTTLEHLRGAGADWERTAKTLTECLSPRIAHALAVTCEKNAATGLHLFSAVVRGGIPAEVCLCLRPQSYRFGHGACVLSVNRAHHEFILESADRRLFYFPPALLCARFTFSAGAPCIWTPVVRQPAGGFAWRHPYTGDLDSDPFGDVTFLDQRASLSYEPSAWARAAFPGLARRMTGAAEKDLCLSGQELAIGRLQDILARQTAAGAEPDALGIVTEIHGLLHLGLCCAHQRNTAAPRVHLTPGEMPYVLKTSEPTPVRIFRYDPRDPAAAALRAAPGRRSPTESLPV